MPALKKFLKGGDAESYRNVEIEYVKGKPPVMTLFVGGKEQEVVLLKEYESSEALHQLFQEKGLQKKTQEEIDENKRRGREERLQEAAARAEEYKKRQREEQSHENNREIRNQDGVVSGNTPVTDGEAMQTQEDPKSASRLNKRDKLPEVMRYGLAEPTALERQKERVRLRELRKEANKRKLEEKHAEKKEKIVEDREARKQENMRQLAEKKKEMELRRKERAEKQAQQEAKKTEHGLPQAEL
jgi:hypothetical protein